jgi:hypothetical protein
VQLNFKVDGQLLRSVAVDTALAPFLGQPAGSGSIRLPQPLSAGAHVIDWEIVPQTADPCTLTIQQIAFADTLPPSTVLDVPGGSDALPAVPSFRTGVSRHKLECEIALPTAALVELQAFDVLGRRCLGTVRLSLGAGHAQIVIPGSERLPAGLYMIRAKIGGSTMGGKQVLLR